MANLKPDRQAFTNIGSTTAAFSLLGGTYGVDIVGSFGGGNITLQKQAADGSTYVSAVASFTANAYAPATLAPGTYRLTFSGTASSGIYAQITRLHTGN